MIQVASAQSRMNSAFWSARIYDATPTEPFLTHESSPSYFSSSHFNHSFDYHQTRRLFCVDDEIKSLAGLRQMNQGIDTNLSETLESNLRSLLTAYNANLEKQKQMRPESRLGLSEKNKAELQRLQMEMASLSQEIVSLERQIVHLYHGRRQLEETNDSPCRRPL